MDVHAGVSSHVSVSVSVTSVSVMSVSVMSVRDRKDDRCDRYDTIQCNVMQCNDMNSNAMQ